MGFVCLFSPECPSHSREMSANLLWGQRCNGPNCRAPRCMGFHMSPLIALPLGHKQQQIYALDLTNKVKKAHQDNYK